MSNRPSLKKYGLGMVLTIFSFVTIFGSVAMAQPAQAQWAVSTLTDMPRMTGELLSKIKEGLGVAVMNAAQKAVSYFLRKLAHDSAVWLASGGKGQSPFANTSSFGDYMKNTAGDAFGEAITALGKPFGLNLCGVPDIKIDLAIKIGLRQRFDDGGPKKEGDCNWNSFVKGWSGDAWKSKYGSKDALQKQFNVSLKADTESDMGIYLKSTQKIDNIVSKKTDDAKLQRQEGQGFKGLTSLISGDVKTPAQVQKKSMEANTGEEQQKKSEAQIGSSLGSGVFQVIPSTLSLFLNTLASTMLKNFKDKGMLPFGVCIGEYGGDYCKSTGKSSVATFEGEGVKIGGRAAASAAFSEFLVASIKAQDNYNILAQLENCPDAPGLYNCRIDGEFVKAVQEATYGTPVTIGEALDKNWIHPDWKLLNDERPENTDVNCKDNAYCYANIKVLRQVRILPVGFEIAALNSDPDNPWTVKQVVDGFNNCNPNGSYDPVNFPFCHLIDPNWVLKVEPTRCNALVNSAAPLMGGAPDRLEDCADLSSCVAYNKDGTCLSYGYCAREKNFWRFEADTCDAQFNTCKAFTDATGKGVAYLYRTLDTSYCDQNSAGCLAYSLNQDSSGKWLDPGRNDSSQYFNNGIHFNNKISTSCGSNSFGCSAFKISSSTDVLYLRKAPDYLKCYDATPATADIYWPKNNADLSKLQPKEDCSLYSKVCTELEVGCNLFTSLLTGEQIPGKFKPADYSSGQVVWNDQCDANCNGYAAYREMPNNYSNGNPIAYIIPSSGRTCKAEEEGCSSFTNMGEVVSGGEKVEYYSYLRPCIKSDATKQKNFYTYEGDKNGGSGYQLKVYTLEKDIDGSPKYWYRTAADAADYENKCNEASYKAGLSDADCRQFNDDSGNVYYRLLAKTIVVNDTCTYYRFNSPEFASSTGGTQTCFQNGEYKNGFCYYYGLPSGIQTTAGVSRTCSASVESCFAYKGNTANNVKQIFRDDFEGKDQTPATTGWSAGQDQLIISTESTHSGEHSLGHAGSSDLVKNLGELVVGRSYVLTFWAKGNKSNVNVELAASAQENNVGIFNTTDVWQYYSFNPVELNGGTTTVRLIFKGGTGSNLFLDNVRLVEITDYQYLVRNTLKVDPKCDSNLDDNLPGEALGCTAYTVAGSPNPFYLTNFSYLCRNEAIGCTAMLDTYNTLDNEKPDAYNVWLSGNPGTKTITVGSDHFSCVVPVGEKGCFTNISGYTTTTILAATGQFVTSTVYIPADTPVSSPIYLVATQEATCNQADLGCTYAGAQAITPTTTIFSAVTIKNDPALYKENLCQSEAVGCNAYSLGEGSYYFKDPVVVGQRVCEYKGGVTVGGVLSSGWFWKGTNNACYPNYIQAGNNYGLWSFGDKSKYENFVGECPANQSGCTEFVDNNDKAPGAANGRAYYFLNNGKISSGDCDGLVSQKSGCVLFDQTDKPGKLWDTTASYLKSEQSGSIKVEPVPNATTNDANIIIKVIRDRQCGEWLQCSTSHRVWDDKNGKWKQICDTFGRCDKAPVTAQESNVANCSHFYESSEYPLAGRLFQASDYVARGTRWTDMDFAGYSILNLYPPEELKQVNINSTTPDWRLTKTLICGGTAAINNCPTTTGGAFITSTDACAREGAPCGSGGAGRCANKWCIINPDGSTFSIKPEEDKLLKHECRGYPEKDSPFPNTTEVGNNSSVFGGVNLCSEGRNGVGDNSQYLPAAGKATNALAFGCDCNYTRSSYGNGMLSYFFNYDQPGQLTNNSVNKFFISSSTLNAPPAGVCQSSIPPKACTTDTDCGAVAGSGMCLLKNKESKLLGWQGYCLERDISRSLYGNQKINPCLSWLPINQLNGVADIDSQHIEAGYNPPQQPPGGNAFCMIGSGSGLASGNTLVGNDPYVFYSRNGSPSINSGVKAFFNGDISCNSTCPGNKILTCDVNGPFCGNYDGKITNNTARCCDSSGNCETAPLCSDTGNQPTCEAVCDKSNFVPVCNYGAHQLGNANCAEAGGVHDRLGMKVYKPNGCGYDWSGGGYKHCYWSWRNDGYGNWSEANEGQFFRGEVNTVGQEAKIRQADIDYIEFVVDGHDSEDPGPGTQFFVYPNATPVNVGNGFYADATVGENRVVASGYYLNRSNWPAFIFGGAKFGVAGGDFRFPADGHIINGNIFKTTGVVDMFNQSDPTHSGADFCPGEDSGWNWNVVALEFDPNTTYLKKYHLYYCDDSPGGGGITYSVTFHLRETCSVVAETKFDTSPQNNSSPWTNRLWKTGVYAGSYPFGYDIFNAPYGSTLFNGGAMSELLYLNNGIKLPLPEGSKYINYKAANDALPSPVGGAPITCNNKDKIEPNSGPYAHNSEEDCVYLTKEDSNGFHYSPFTLKTPGNPVDTLSELFARPFGSYVWSYKYGYNEKDTSAEKYATSSDYFYNKTEELTSIANAPQVHPVDMDHCNNDGLCVEKNIPGITVNNKYNENAKIFTSPAMATIRFFAYADRDQMPLRNVTVDWGDSIVIPRIGFFRNGRGAYDQNSNDFECIKNSDPTKPNVCAVSIVHAAPPGGNKTTVKDKFTDNICSDVADCKSESLFFPICRTGQTDALDFGHILGTSCDSHYFESSHIYQCTIGGKGWAAGDACPDDYMKKLYTGCCVFQPKVQVKDNWGWCNGVCGNADSSGGVGCYDYNNNSPAAPGKPQKVNECTGSTPGAWTYFGGGPTSTLRVLVAPRQQ